MSVLTGNMIALMYTWQFEPAWLEVKRVTLKLPRLSPAFAGFRLVQVSDIHMGGWMNARHFEAVMALVLAEAPDMLALTGDFVNKSESKRKIRAAVADLDEVLKSSDHLLRMAVLGNHDLKAYPAMIREMLAARGVIDLTNAVFPLTRGGEQLHFAGVDDWREGRPDLKKVVRALPEDGAAILLSHEPDFADESAATGRFDLQISGHSHGGQVVLPFIGPPLLPSGGRKYYDGLYQVGTMLQYTTRGVGMTDPFIRFNCRPEITVFTLRAGA